MSEKNEWKKGQLSEEELKEVAGGASVTITYECQTCHKVVSFDPANGGGSPWCCGEPMRFAYSTAC